MRKVGGKKKLLRNLFLTLKFFFRPAAIHRSSFVTYWHIFKKELLLLLHVFEKKTTLNRKIEGQMLEQNGMCSGFIHHIWNFLAWKDVTPSVVSDFSFPRRPLRYKLFIILEKRIYISVLCIQTNIPLEFARYTTTNLDRLKIYNTLSVVVMATEYKVLFKYKIITYCFRYLGN